MTPRGHSAATQHRCRSRCGWVALLLCLATILPVANSLYSAERSRANRILVISTGSRFSLGFPILEQGIIERLRQLRSGDFDLYGESLDIVRFPSDSYHRVFRDYLRDKYADDLPDLIILLYVGNLGVAQRLLGQLFPSTPVVAAGLTEEELAPAALGDRFTGVVQRSDPAGTLALIQRLQPDIRKILLIGGTADVDRDVMNRVRQATRPYAGRLEFEIWDNLSMQELLDAVTRLPAHTAILFGRMFRDGAGRAVISANAAQSIAKVANAPVYVLNDPSIGSGAVGGSVSDILSLGRRAGEIANQVLSGAEPKSLPLQILNEGVPIFDWRALKRWRIDERQLPSNSIVRFRPLSMWEQYRWHLTAALVVFTLQATLITGLLWERRRRRRTQEYLDERLRFEELVSQLSARFIHLPSQKIEEQIVDSLREAAKFLGFDFSTLSVFTGPAEGRVAFIWQAPGTPAIPSNLSEKDFPWMTRELFAGRDVSFLNPGDLPREAEMDRAAVERIRNRSVHCVPLVTGETPIGVLNVGTFDREQNIAPGLLQRLRLLGEIFANALARKRSYELLRESEERFGLAAESANLGVWSWDLSNDSIWASEKCRALYEISAEQEITFQTFLRSLHESDRDRVLRSIDDALRSKTSFAEEYRVVLADGAIRWIGAFGRGHSGESGEPLRMLGVSIDITERKRAEERFTLAIEASPSAIVMSENDGRIVLVNAQTEKLFGYTRQELIGQPVEILVPERFRRRHAVDRAAYITAPEARPMGVGRDLYARRKNGSEVRVEIGLAPIHSHEGGFVLTSIVDISARKQAEEDLEKERAFLRQVIDIDPNFVFAKDRDGRFTLANRGLADAYGTTVENLVGKTDADFNPNVEEVEFSHRMDLEVINTLEERFIAEEHITDSDGKVHWLQTVKRPIMDSDGSARQVLGSSTDITARKAAEAELQRNRDELAHMTRIATLGELVASLAHELNQPLGAILSNAAAAEMLLMTEPPALEEVREILADIRKDDRRASAVIHGLRGLTRRQEIEREPLQINEALEEVIRLVSIDATHRRITLTLEPCENLPQVFGNRVQLQQVTMNLILNAMEAISERENAPRQVVIRSAAADGMIRVAVSDSGPGIAADKLSKLFEPFVTTKKNGMGMGLSIARTIVEAHGGRIWAESQSQDATFYFTVPALMKRLG